MNNFNPLAILDRSTFSLLLAEVVKFITQILATERDDRLDKANINSSSELDFIVQLTSNPSFGVVAPARQVAWRTRQVPGIRDYDHVEQLRDEFEKFFELISGMENNKSEREIFIEWARDIDKGITAPFKSPDSPGFVNLNQVASDHAIRYEFGFMESIWSNLKPQTEQTLTYLSIIKALGLWTWTKAKAEKSLLDNLFLVTPLRFNSIVNLLVTTYNHRIPIIWGMATEQLTSSTQMTLLGLRISQDMTDFPPKPDVYETGNVFYYIECDFTESQHGNNKLFLNYKNQKPDDLRDWTRQNIKDGLVSIGNHAIDICFEIGERLYSCGCGAESSDINALSKLANSQIDEPTKKRRQAFRIFARDYVRKTSYPIPPDMLETPLIFKYFDDLFPAEIYQMCSYVAHWWYEKCVHSPNEEDIREMYNRIQTLDWILDSLEKEAPCNVITEDSLTSTAGKTIRQIIKNAQDLSKQRDNISSTDLDQLNQEWPTIKALDIK